MTEQHPRWRELKFTLHRIFRNPSAVIGFLLILFFLAVAVFAPYIAPPKYAHNPYLMPHKGFSPTPKPPSKTHILGTASGQYDIFYGVVWGTRTAFKIGFFVVGFAALVGIARLTTHRLPNDFAVLRGPRWLSSAAGANPHAIPHSSNRS